MSISNPFKDTIDYANDGVSEQRLVKMQRILSITGHNSHPKPNMKGRHQIQKGRVKT